MLESEKIEAIAEHGIVDCSGLQEGLMMCRPDTRHPLSPARLWLQSLEAGISRAPAEPRGTGVGPLIREAFRLDPWLAREHLPLAMRRLGRAGYVSEAIALKREFAPGATLTQQIALRSAHCHVSKRGPKPPPMVLTTTPRRRLRIRGSTQPSRRL